MEDAGPFFPPSVRTQILSGDPAPWAAAIGMVSLTSNSHIDRHADEETCRAYWGCSLRWNVWATLNQNPPQAESDTLSPGHLGEGR